MVRQWTTVYAGQILNFKNIKEIKTISTLKKKQDHLRRNVAPDQAITLGLQIFLDHRSSSSLGQKVLMILQPRPPFPTSPLFRS